MRVRGGGRERGRGRGRLRRGSQGETCSCALSYTPARKGGKETQLALLYKKEKWRKLTLGEVRRRKDA